MTGPAPAEPPEPAPGISPGSRYVAMGSSFAAGPGIGRRAPGSPRAAGRSSANYAHLFARRLGLDLDDVTFSGATTQDILAATAAGRPAQIDAVTSATKLVTLTGGGNDVGWAPRILPSSLPRPVRAIPPVRRQLDSYTDPDLTEQRFGTLRDNLLKIAAEVRRRAPESPLAFVDYLTVLPPDGTTPTGVLPADVAEWGRAVARRLSPASPGTWPPRAGASSWPRRRRAPVTMPGRLLRGPGVSISACAAGRPTIPTPPAWRR